MRYSLNALLCLEMTYKPLDDILAVDFKKWEMDTVLHLAHAAMCSLQKNRKAVIRRDFEHVRPDLHALGDFHRIIYILLFRVSLHNKFGIPFILSVKHCIKKIREPVLFGDRASDIFPEYGVRCDNVRNTTF